MAREMRDAAFVVRAVIKEAPASSDRCRKDLRFILPI
jgi:hypothetical protein